MAKPAQALSMNDTSLDSLYHDALGLLKELIQTPSFSKQEDGTASIISRFLALKGLATTRVGNNVFVANKYFDAAKPTLLLNSHHDTVKPNPQYTKDPFTAIVEEGRLYHCSFWKMGAGIYYYQRRPPKERL